MQLSYKELEIIEEAMTYYRDFKEKELGERLENVRKLEAKFYVKNLNIQKGYIQDPIQVEIQNTIKSDIQK